MNIFKRLWAAFDDRIGLSSVIMPIVKHPVPKDSDWRYVFGSATLISFVVAVITGIPLASMYIPATGEAYQSLVWITHGAFLGNQIRALHYYGGVAMLVLVGIHALRVFLTGSFKYPRELNWLTGVVLFFLTVGIVFTGQIVRWDQFGVWTIAITTFQATRTPIIGNWLAHVLLGGPTFNGTTLSRFFALHVFILPGLIFAFIGVHLYLVVHHGISELPRRGRPVDPKTYKAWYHDLIKREGVPFWPDAAWRDVVFGTLVIVLIVAFALIVKAPELVGPPDPSLINVEPRPDWFFLWYYAALALLPEKVEDYVIIGGPLLLAVLMIGLPFVANKGERSPSRRPWSVITAMIIVLIMGSLLVTGEIAPWSPRFNAQPLPASVIGTSSGSVYRGAQIWHAHGCEYCHQIDGYGGIRGPNLSDVGDRLTASELTIRILNGGTNMPAFARQLTPSEVSDLVAFLQSRRMTGKGQGQAAGATNVRETAARRRRQHK